MGRAWEESLAQELTQMAEDGERTYERALCSVPAGATSSAFHGSLRWEHEADQMSLRRRLDECGEQQGESASR